MFFDSHSRSLFNDGFHNIYSVLSWFGVLGFGCLVPGGRFKVLGSRCLVPVIHVQYRRFDSNGKALFLIVRTVQIDSSYSIGIRTIHIDQMDTIFFHSTHACQMIKSYHAVYNTVFRSQSNESN